jgi:hypothetical protein
MRKEIAHAQTALLKYHVMVLKFVNCGMTGQVIYWKGKGNMKIKVDFVTNSSSSSFVVMGVNVNKDDVPKEKIIEALEKHGLEVNDDNMDEGVDCVIEDLIKGSDLDYSFGSCWDDEDHVMVGIHYTSMKDDETLADFKLRVKNQLKDSFGVDSEPAHIEECWEDR